MRFGNRHPPPERKEPILYAAATQYVPRRSWLGLFALLLMLGGGVRAFLAGAGSSRATEPVELRRIEATLHSSPAIAPQFEAPAPAPLTMEALGWEVLGAAGFEEREAVFLRPSGESRQMAYRVGDVVGGFRLAAIESESVEFERGELKFVLALASEAPPVAFEPAQNAEALEAARSRLLDAAIERKVREGSPKTVVAGGVETPGPTPREMPRAVVSLPFWDEAPGRAPAVKFIMPLEGRISSKFGYRQAPMGGARRYHRGVDIAAPNGSPIKAMADGVVAKVSTSYAKGLNVEIQHAAGFSTAYFHLSKSMVKAGQRVRQGEVIAQEGSSGNSTGPHLHFEIHKNGEPVNPALYLRELN